VPRSGSPTKEGWPAQLIRGGRATSTKQQGQCRQAGAPPKPRRSLLQSCSLGPLTHKCIRGESVNLHHLVCILPCRLHYLLERDAFVHSSPGRGKNAFAIAVGLSLRNERSQLLCVFRVSIIMLCSIKSSLDIYKKRQS
jgi:hypothetical protein